MENFKPEFVDALLKAVKVHERVSKMDGKEVLWRALALGLFNDQVKVFSFEDAIIQRIENLLYPEYDGNQIVPEDWGWNTENGPIIYDQEKFNEYIKNEQKSN